MAAAHTNASVQGPTTYSAPQELLDLVERTSYRRLASVLDGMVALSTVRKSSKSVSSHWMLDILAITEARALVLTATLYFENLAERYLRQKSMARKRKPIAVESRKDGG